MLIQESFQRISARLSLNRFEPIDDDSGIKRKKSMNTLTESLRNEEQIGKSEVLQIDTDLNKSGKGNMILHCKDGTKKIVSLYIDESGLNMVIGDDIYPLLNVQSITLKDAEKYIEFNDISADSVLHIFTIQIDDGEEIEHIVLEATDQKERDLWFHHIMLMVKVCYIEYL